MASLRRILGLFSVGSALVLAGCGGAPTVPSSSASQPAITSSAVPVPTTPSTSPAVTSTACPAGDYTVTSFATTRLNAEQGKGKGGQVGVEFEEGRYAVDFDGDQPIRFELKGSSGRLIVDGEMTGTYTGSGQQMNFTLGSARGTARFTSGGESRTITMKQLAAIIGLRGAGSASCSGGDMTLKTKTVSVELVRDSD